VGLKFTEHVDAGEVVDGFRRTLVGLKFTEHVDAGEVVDVSDVPSWV